GCSKARGVPARGMEGKHRQVSESELPTYRKNPEKFYSDLIAVKEWPDLTKLNVAIRELQNSPLFHRIRERALSGQPPIQEDLDQYRRQVELVRGENTGILEEMNSAFMCLRKNGMQLSL